ncbi:MAG TPA: radical SAM protein [Thermoanaerobaculia bacterium]|nr:radical SAM protein [Thermoanaerobaculia bacterium]
MKSITLVNPSEGFSKALIPLGLASISAYLKKYGAIEDVRLLDSNCQDIYREMRPTDMVGITAVTQDMPHAMRFAEFVKREYGVPIVLGGVHVSTTGELPPPFDIGVIGEGERTMLELSRLGDFSPEPLRQVKGICFRDGGRVVQTPDRDLIDPLDEIPIPDREIANMPYYLQPRTIIPYHHGRSMTMISSRGCPFRCVFCSTRVHWKRFRGFSADRVIEEIELLIGKYRTEIIHIFDDLFIADRKRLALIHQAILKQRIHERVRFMCLVRSDLLDDDTMRILKEMNVVVTGIGMESGDDRVLRYLKRRTATTQENRRAIELADRWALPTMGSFMVGNPDETEEDIRRTLAFIRSYRYSPYLSPLVYIATAFPGTDFWEWGKSRGIPVDAVDRIVMDVPDDARKLDGAPLLTDIPRDRFFALLRLFVDEMNYGAIKGMLYEPSFRRLVQACLMAVRIERNPVRGIVEVAKIYSNFVSLRRAARARALGTPAGVDPGATGAGVC